MSKTAVRATDRVTQTVAALARLLDQVMNDIQALDSEVQEQVLAASTEWGAERAQLVAECERVNDLLEQARKDHDRALGETDEAAAVALDLQVSTAVDRLRAKLTEQMDAERAILVAERNRAQQRLADEASDSERQLTEVRAELTGEIESLKRQVEEAKQAAAQAPASTEVSSDESPAVQAEIARAESLIQEISQIVENPHTELSVVIRKSAERAELHSYLRGLRFRVSAK